MSERESQDDGVERMADNQKRLWHVKESEFDLGHVYYCTLEDVVRVHPTADRQDLTEIFSRPVEDQEDDEDWTRVEALANELRLTSHSVHNAATQLKHSKDRWRAFDMLLGAAIATVIYAFIVVGVLSGV